MMDNYVDVVETTAEYIKAFNNNDIDAIEQLLDSEILMSSSRRSGFTVGKKPVINRVNKIWKWSKKTGKIVRASQGLIDLPDSPSRPCIVMFYNKKAMSVVILRVNDKRKVYMISALVGDIVKTAKLTDRKK